MDKYYIPFLPTHTKKDFTTKEIREILPENNIGYKPIPQIISNDIEGTLLTINKLKNYGYNIVNLNFGCPSNTVVSRGRGAGFLAKKDELYNYLYEIFSKSDMKISVKTRIGMYNPEEVYDLMDIYNKFELEELIIHPRIGRDYYNNYPNMSMFTYCAKESKNPICYNGDLCSISDINKFSLEHPSVLNVMIGRGILKNPTMLDGEVNTKRILGFLDYIYNDYNELYNGNVAVVYKMKEIWMYLQSSFPDGAKLFKKIKKLNNTKEYENFVKNYLRINN